MINTDLTPPRPEFDPKRSLIVFTEDSEQKTYVEWLRNAYDHPLLNIRPLPSGATVAEAMAHAAATRRAEGEMGTHFDESWCMLSLADSPSLDSAIDIAARHDVRLAGTVGGIANWIRLHWEQGEPVPSPLIGEVSVEAFEDILASRRATAVRRAIGTPGITTVHELLQSLQRSADGFSGTK